MRMPTFATIQHSTAVLARAISQGKKKKVIQIGNEKEVICSQMTWYVENAKEATKLNLAML